MMVMKRKRSSSPLHTRTPSPEDLALHQSSTKRRRCSILEHGFAHLTLNNTKNNLNYFTLPADVTLPPSQSALKDPLPQFQDSYMEDIDLREEIPLQAISCLSSPLTLSHNENVIFPSSIEEPLLPEVKMKSSSWYEPEPDRIVITDLDISDDEDEVNGDNTYFSLHPALLEHMKTRTFDSTPVKLKSPPQSQALVLFKPISLFREIPSATSRDFDDPSPSLSADVEAGPTDNAKDDDAMDVE